MHNAGRIDTKILVVYLGVFEAFKLLNKAVVRVDKRNDHWKTSFNEAFFASTAECGVRTIYFDSGIRSTIKVDLWAALSFGFAEPTTGGHRNISGVLFELDGNYVFKQLLERASELDGSQRVDFKFTISSIMLRTDPAGFEKYRKDAWSWAWTTSRTASR
ncbi:hypothetical protein AAVH_19214 [Aphelenchoides avenae]|nr:hypothetical protein AAVH_19214 [Aphelenchus avenae]